MQVIGLDPSYTCFAGVLLTEPNQHTLKEWKTKPNPARFQRIETLATGVLEFVTSAQKLGRVDLVLIEGYSFGSMQGREAAGELGGAVRMAILKRGIPLAEVPPTSLKKYVTGKGNAQKNEVMMFCLKKWGYQAPDDNAADAFALAHLAQDYVDWRAGKSTSAALEAYLRTIETIA